MAYQPFVTGQRREMAQNGVFLRAKNFVQRLILRMAVLAAQLRTMLRKVIGMLTKKKEKAASISSARNCSELS